MVSHGVHMANQVQFTVGNDSSVFQYYQGVVPLAAEHNSLNITKSSDTLVSPLQGAHNKQDTAHNMGVRHGIRVWCNHLAL